MRTVYLDNAATSYPKAPGVGAAMADYIERCLLYTSDAADE